MFELHPRLSSDTIPVVDWPLCRVLLMNECAWPWLVLVPRRHGVTGIRELDAGDRETLIRKSPPPHLSLAEPDRGRQDERGRPGQRGATTACPRHRPLRRRPRLAQADVRLQAPAAYDAEFLRHLPQLIAVLGDGPG